ncbi:MAG: adenylate/guanylate cyclase response regulator, partial [Mucilaginibacter sp.]|nr:adenylate/guanylate cyclase response regulator [Mucilaginibacter sp.]
MAKILVVDDEADLEILVKQKFRKKIRENVYQFIFAQNGEEALQKVKEHPDVDIILSDINMPVMDGL